MIHLTFNTVSEPGDLTAIILRPPCARTLIFWDADDTLVMTKDKEGPRRALTIDELELRRLFHTLDETLPKPPKHLILSQGSVQDLFEPPCPLSFLAPYFLRCPSFEPVTPSVSLQPLWGCNEVGSSPYFAAQHLAWGTSCPLAGVTLLRRGDVRNFAPSPHCAFLNFDKYSKIDVVWSFARSAMFDRVVFVDNSLMELGMLLPGFSSTYYCECGTSLAQQKELFLSSFAQLQYLARERKGEAAVEVSFCHFRKLSILERPYHKIFPCETGCSDLDYATFLKTYTVFLVSLSNDPDRKSLSNFAATFRHVMVVEHQRDVGEKQAQCKAEQERCILDLQRRIHPLLETLTEDSVHHRTEARTLARSLLLNLYFDLPLVDPNTQWAFSDVLFTVAYRTTGGLPFLASIRPSIEEVANAKNLFTAP